MGKGLGGVPGRGEKVDSRLSTVCDCHTVCLLCVCGVLRCVAPQATPLLPSRFIISSR